MRVIAYYRDSDLVVDDIDPAGSVITPRIGHTGRFTTDNAVAMGWIWSDAAEGFVPPPPVDPSTIPVTVPDAQAAYDAAQAAEDAASAVRKTAYDNLTTVLQG